MEDFIMATRTNLDQFIRDSQEYSGIRRLFQRVIESVPEIIIMDKCNKDGDLKFSVPLSDLGIDYKFYQRKFLK